MLRDDPRQNPQSELDEDLQFMLSSIRARQNTLIFFLQRFNKILQLNQTEFKLSKNQFQQKQKIYSRQINSILQKHSQFSFGNLYAVRAFWIKLKTIIKVSIQRISSLNIPQLEKLHECYGKALTAITRISDSQKSLAAYKQVQNCLKKRSIQASMLGRQASLLGRQASMLGRQASLLGRSAISPSPISYSQSKIQKNRSQTLFKLESAVSRFAMQNQGSHAFSKGQTFTLSNKQRVNKIQYLKGLVGIREESNAIQQPKIKSLNRIKNRRPDQVIKANILNFIKVQQLGKLKSSSKASEKHIKKINRHVEKYEKNFQGAFDGKYEVATLLDKRKTIFQNVYSLYDNLFAKNIPNHKMISKFMFNNTKINQILYNKYEKKKKADRKNKLPNADSKAGKENPPRKHKEKEKQTMQQKQKHGEKQSKQNRKIHSAKEHHQIQIIQINTKQKQHIKQKKQSETTAITSKHTNHQRQVVCCNQKSDKQKQRKNQRSKTAKIKANSDFHNPNYLQGLNHNFFVGKHFISQHQTNKDKAGAQKLVKIIGI